MLTRLRMVTLVMLVVFSALLATGCKTTFQEWSGKMPNQNTRHYAPPDQPYQFGQSGEEAVRPVVAVAQRAR